MIVRLCVCVFVCLVCLVVLFWWCGFASRVNVVGVFVCVVVCVVCVCADVFVCLSVCLCVCLFVWLLACVVVRVCGYAFVSFELFCPLFGVGLRVCLWCLFACLIACLDCLVMLIVGLFCCEC